MQQVSRTPLSIQPVEPPRPPSSIRSERSGTATPNQTAGEEPLAESFAINAGTGAKTPTPLPQEQETARFARDPAIGLALQESNQLVGRLGETMDNISKVLASIQHSLVRVSI
jgi:hypothetical protein